MEIDDPDKEIENIKKDNIKKDNIKKDNIKKDNIKKDNIKKDNAALFLVDSRIKNYFDYVKHMQSNGWARELVTLHENLSAITTINSLKANNEGIVIDIRCPPGYRISIMGINSVPEGYSIDAIHSLETMFADLNGTEIDRDTGIVFMVDKVTRKTVQIDTTLYSNISSTNFEETTNRFKDCRKLFRFNDGIEIKDEEHLRIYAIDPDTDITNVKFNFFTDLWIKKE